MRIVFEKVPDSNESSFGCFQAGGRMFGCPYHIHPEVEIFHIQSGAGLLVVGDYIDRFATGDMLVLGGGLPHMLCSDAATTDPNKSTEIRYIQFRPEAFGESFWRMPEQHQVQRLLSQAARGLRISRTGADHALPILNELWTTQGARRLWRLMELLECLAESRAAVPLASLGYAAVITHRDSERLNRAIQYVSTHLTEDVKLADVANVAGFSPQAFSRFFHKYTGTRFINYVIALRISLACRHLLETDQTIAAICFACGFNNLSNFNHQFSRIKGLTPQTFRRNAQPGT
jgi:AraC-like DNA-binding protein